MNINISDIPLIMRVPTPIYTTPDGRSIDFRGRIYYKYSPETKKCDIPYGVYINKQGNLIVLIEDFKRLLYEDVYNIRQAQCSASFGYSFQNDPFMTIHLFNVPLIRLAPKREQDTGVTDYRCSFIYGEDNEPIGYCVDKNGRWMIFVDDFKRLLYEDIYNIRQQQYAEEARYMRG